MARGTYVPLPGGATRRHIQGVITGVIIHIENDLPIVVDMEVLPSAGDQVVRCTNVRTVDGKRPSFVHDRNSTFLLPIRQIRVIEAPSESASEAAAQETQAAALRSQPPAPLEMANMEPDEDLLARIRDV